MTAATGWAIISLVLSTSAAADIVYDLEAQCSSGCTGTATAVLVVADTYTPGTPIATADFVSFSYTSSSGSFTIPNDLALLTFDNGILPVVTGPSVSWVEIDAAGSNTGLNACGVAGVPDNFFCPTEHDWSVEAGPAGISRDFGTDHTWTRRDAIVSVDVNPGRDLRCKNQRPVAVLGGPGFDATQINVETLVFGATGNGPAPSCWTDDVNDDGFLDLLCKFVPGTAEATLSGELNDGTKFQGSDHVCAAR